MNTNKPIAALFDLDGVIFDTETQYSKWWTAFCQQHRPDIPNLGNLIKGQTLSYIFDMYFPDKALQDTINEQLATFEAQMDYSYIPGVRAFIDELLEHQARLVIVTSSNQDKLRHVRRAHPEIDHLFDRILSAEDFTASKPDPFCYLLGARVCETDIENCVVFEDSFNGLKAGMSSGICTVGLATTNPREAIEPCCHQVIDDFQHFHWDDLMNLLSR